MTERRTCILVLGMHRSGSSAATGCLAHLGVGMPAHMLGSNSSNPTGHWEPQPIIDFNDGLLKEIASAWHDWRAVDLAMLGAERLASRAAELRRILLEEFGEAKLFALKDPRICRLVPFYLDVLASLGVDVRVLITVRHPADVARSLDHRDRIARPFAELLWLRHVIDPERLTRHLPRAVVPYPWLLDHPAEILVEAARQLGVAWPAGDIGVADAVRFVSREHDHSGPEPGAHDELIGLLERVWTAMLGVAEGRDLADELTALGTEFEAADHAGTSVRRVVAGETARAKQEVARLQSHLAEVQQRLVAAEQSNASVAAALMQEREKSAGLEQRLAAAEDALGAELARREARISARFARSLRRLGGR